MFEWSIKHITPKNIAMPLVGMVAGWVLVRLVVGFFFQVEQPDFGVILNALLYGSVLEELLKWALALVLVGLFRYAATPIFIGLGFGIGEQYLYWSVDGSIVTATIFMHIAAGLVSFYYFRQYVKKSRRRDLLLAIVAPLVVHLLYNLMLGAYLVF